MRVMGTAHWGEDGIYWLNEAGGATAFALRRTAIDPQNKLIEPVSNWLIKNRRGAQWSNTRDTAIVVLAMNDYLRVSGELKTDLEYELIVNGQSIANKKVSGADVFNAPSRFTIDPKLVKDANEIRIVRRPRRCPRCISPLKKMFQPRRPIAPVKKKFSLARCYKLVSVRRCSRDTCMIANRCATGKRSQRQRVETLLTAKNNYSTDVPGSQAVGPRSRRGAQRRTYARELKSGAVDRKFSATNPATMDALPRITAVDNPQSEVAYTGRSRWVHQELRDRKVALFLDKLPEGVWEIRYDLRAEVPGKFHALPVVGQAMYVPEIRCNGAEVRIKLLNPTGGSNEKRFVLFPPMLAADVRRL